VDETKGIKKKLEDLKQKIEELYRVFTAVINDENYSD
jgi:hypothetical protein